MAVKYPDLEGFAFSFSHAKIVMNGKLYTAISDVSISQALEESAVFGASQKPLRRSSGQLQMGEGTVTFSDFEEANEFIKDLGDKPMNKLWSLEYTLENESAVVRTIECQACRLTAVTIAHSSGADALGLELPFSFLSSKVNGKELV